MKIAKVLINTNVKSLNKVYDYIIPEKLEEMAMLGKRVGVFFGRSKEMNEGIIVKIDTITKEELENIGYKLKSIDSILDDVSYIDSDRLKLAKYMSYVYFCNVYDALKLMLPPGTGSRNSSKKINVKMDTLIKLCKSCENIQQDIEDGKITSAKHIKLLKFLIENDYVLQNDIIEGLGISKSVLDTVRKNGYIEFEKVEKKEEQDFTNIEKTLPKLPNEEQKEAIEKISSNIKEGKFKQFLLFGVTGSGKTEVYLQLIQRAILEGKRAIVLVPEISLTYQTVSRFVGRFGNRVAILHSKMTISKRKEEYKKIKEGKVDIVVGARSAIFAPVEKLGLVVIDEEHDSSYYSQTTPKYSTKEIAAYICNQKNATLVLGSATPEITSFYKAKNGIYELVKLTKRAGDAKLPEIEIVDMKEDKLMSNTLNISLRLKEEILKNLQKKEQTMIFLNRRGYVSYLHCNDCSYIFKCPNCDVAMTYHKNNNLLHCHYCSYVEQNVNTCPVCGSENITSSTVGTQKIEEELKQVFPNITTIRMDADTTITKDSHQKILDKFRNEKIDVLIGTQMISKGHDIENVTLVGVLGVDSMLGMNDYLSAEKAFSNIYQVSGRAGRSKLPGRVLIQTSDTDSYILKAILENSYENFYNEEIEFRNVLKYPPFCDLVLFEMSSLNLYELKTEATRLYRLLNIKASCGYKVFSPATPFIQKINKKYRLNILVKTKLNSSVYTALHSVINTFNKNRKKSINLSISKNPMFIN